MSVLSQFTPSTNIINKVPIEIFGVGGGGGGSSWNPGSPLTIGGGGAGLVIYRTLDVTKGISYPITIGAGGAGGAQPFPIQGGDGNDTTFERFSMYGGGGGGTPGSPPPGAGVLGSLGGGRSASTAVSYSDGTGFSLRNDGNVSGGSGGGGATGVSVYRTALPGSGFIDGGSGIGLDVIGISTIRVGGGGGGFIDLGPSGGRIGVGTDGGGQYPVIGGTANTGGGGGDRSAGGSGVLFIRYPTAYAAATVSGNTPAPSQPGYYVYRWNSGPGSITFN